MNIRMSTKRWLGYILSNFAISDARKIFAMNDDRDSLQRGIENVAFVFDHSIVVERVFKRRF